MNAVSVRELSYAYPGGRVALERISFTLAPGERLAVLGPNGAGKSTLLLALCGVIIPPLGVVQVADRDPAIAAQCAELPQHVGFIFPDSDDQLIHASVQDDVAFGPQNLGLPVDEVQRRVQQALTQTSLLGYEQRVPYRLSAGEKRRAALAGVLAMQPSVLLLDEPTVFLDPRGRREIIQLLGTLAATQIVATHDLDLAQQLCPRALLLDNGRVAAEGATATLLADAALLARCGM
jgi:cobalt/nickel transport system ATP-binding protein